MARYYAIQAALTGEIPWTGELAREYNKRWLACHAPAIFKVIPNAKCLHSQEVGPILRLYRRILLL